MIGVSAVRRDGIGPDYSNRDAVYNDSLRRATTSSRPSVEPRRRRSGCTDAYSDCGPFEFRAAIGTSFAAPQVCAAAALLLGSTRR